MQVRLSSGVQTVTLIRKNPRSVIVRLSDGSVIVRKQRDVLPDVSSAGTMVAAQVEAGSQDYAPSDQAPRQDSQQ